MLTRMRCLVTGHRWGAIEGDSWGGYHTCTRCGRSKRFDSEHHAESHDHLGINH